MTKYTIASSQRRAPNAKPQVDPLWRGVGCIMMVVVPVISFMLASFTVNLAVGQNWPVPYQLMGPPAVPSLLFQSQALTPIALFIQQQQNLYAILIMTLAYIVVIGAVVSSIYSIVYRFVGPPRYGPLDAAPADIKVKRYKR